MPAPRSLRPALAIALAASLGGTATWFLGTPHKTESAASAPSREISADAGPRNLALDADLVPSSLATDSAAARAELAGQLRARLNRPGLRADELVLAFKDADAYRRFLERARAAGLEVVGRIDSLHTLRVRVSDYDSLVGELAAHVGDYAAIGANPILSATPPPPDDRSARSATPVGNNLLAALGLGSGADTSAWGRGVLIAVLDGGAAPDSTLGTRLRYQDIGYGLTGLGADGAHGTAVASLAAGASPDARGVAPAADLLSIRVTGADGSSDAFSVAQGILAALDSGAQVINISLGGYATSPVLTEAVERAISAGVAIVASGGNDQAARLVWPAAYPGVVSVGATDAAGIQAMFSNSGESLQLTAPGYAIQAAGLAGTRTSFSGTSASAPVAAGAIAAVVSQSPGLTPLQAADILATYSNDGGAAGADPDYGHGSLNLGWVMDRANPARSDPAVSSQNYNAAAGAVSIVVQNRGAQTLAGLSLDVQVGGTTSRQPVPELAPGASTTIVVAAPAAETRPGASLVVASRLGLPAGLTDQNLANNRQAGLLTLPER